MSLRQPLKHVSTDDVTSAQEIQYNCYVIKLRVTCEDYNLYCYNYFIF